MTNRASWPIQIAIAAGLALALRAAPVLAETTPAPVTPTTVQARPVKLPGQPPIIVALTSCTRVGNRMVC